MASERHATEHESTLQSTSRIVFSAVLLSSNPYDTSCLQASLHKTCKHADDQDMTLPYLHPAPTRTLIIV